MSWVAEEVTEATLEYGQVRQQGMGPVPAGPGAGSAAWHSMIRKAAARAAAEREDGVSLFQECWQDNLLVRVVVQQAGPRQPGRLRDVVEAPGAESPRGDYLRRCFEDVLGPGAGTAAGGLLLTMSPRDGSDQEVSDPSSR